MKLKNIFITGALAATAFVAVPASAAGGVYGELGTAGGVNDYVNTTRMGNIFTNDGVPPRDTQGPQIEGWFGDHIQLSDLYSGSIATLQFDFFGAEANFKNQFVYNNEVLFQTTGGTAFTPPGTDGFLSVTRAASAGLLNFKFVLNGGNSGSAEVTNAANSSILTNTNFFSSYGVPVGGLKTPDTHNDNITPSSYSYVWLFLDDGGAGPDDNHDDMLVRITAVPEPATLGLLGLGLVGLGALRRRKTA